MNIFYEGGNLPLKAKTSNKGFTFTTWKDCH